MFFLFLHIFPKRGVTQYNTHLKHLSSMIPLGNDLMHQSIESLGGGACDLAGKHDASAKYCLK